MGLTTGAGMVPEDTDIRWKTPRLGLSNSNQGGRGIIWTFDSDLTFWADDKDGVILGGDGTAVVVYVVAADEEEVDADSAGVAAAKAAERTNAGGGTSIDAARLLLLLLELDPELEGANLYPLKKGLEWASSWMAQ